MYEQKCYNSVIMPSHQMGSGINTYYFGADAIGVTLSYVQDIS